MGVLNVTPDSFSDGGLYLDPAAAVAQGLKLLAEGADIVDVGGESTRPGAPATSAAEEMRRILAVIAKLKRERPDCILSVDTYKSEVAGEAVAAGADIVNDVSGFTWDERMDQTIAGLGCGAIVMHTRGRPEQWRTLPRLENPIATVRRELAKLAEHSLAAGISRDRLVLDPGFGFGKNFEENYPLLGHFDDLQALGFPLLAGVSRKSFLRRAGANRGFVAEPNQRVAASVAAAVICVLKGAHIIRAHDVAETVQAMAVVDQALLAGNANPVGDGVRDNA